MTTTIEGRIAEELGVRERQVSAAVELLDGGSTVPFIARYRKEATEMLDDAQLRSLEERLRYLRELEERRETILESVRGQGKLTEELEAQIRAADSKARLEDIYLPYKPKRRTKAQIAREAGLEPLAEGLLADPTVEPTAAAAAFVDAEKGVADPAAALEGARAILAERFSEDADLIGALRDRMWNKGRLASRVREGKEEQGAKFADYFDFAEDFTALPSHRVLAMLRGEKEEILDLDLDPEPAEASASEPGPSWYERSIANRFGVRDEGRPADPWLAETVRWAWRTRVLVHLGIDLRTRLRTAAEDEAVRVFASNLRDLLLAAPAGARTTLGLDPGLRTGVKVAVIDATGKVAATDTIYPHAPHKRWDESLAKLAALTEEHGVDLIAIGNGTASRETDKLAGELLTAKPGLKLTKVMVSEAGASVYSASAYASRELPELDVSLRGAVSIARRLQDPLAELVKIDPKSIGVGQYQHDLSEMKLSRSLDAVVEDCVNGVGVDVNTASAPLLSRVSGIGSVLAENIVAHRDGNGPFKSRKELKDVARLGPKAFEQCAGFLRVLGGDDPLDASAVHPEAYPVVRDMVKAAGTDVPSLIGNSTVLRALDPKDFVKGPAGDGGSGNAPTIGLPTVTDILRELEKPGRDPRPAFRTASFREGVEKLTDLEPGMVLEGVVTNVAAFGAFVDVGVHQDGLVHVSAMSKTFVKDPRDVVKPGDIVRVKVQEVDEARKRISLTLRLDEEAEAEGGSSTRRGREGREGSRQRGGGNGGTRGGARGAGGNATGGGKGGGAPRQRQGEGGAPKGGAAAKGGGAGAKGGGGAGAGKRRGAGSSAPAPGNSEMAEALRRAGLA
ncbi:Tex family protein [Streptomyces iconiensis]|uniref:Tex family protein n=1 Tax=Streptomyces iconiensis TaxID=1384038 RepID=A0ABT6ZPT8_9ACTN|nr:Tex family protein [Streptomyces iconiensis]MDJ1131077.1 Tex family protein [Streptomyces iconiensis]